MRSLPFWVNIKPTPIVNEFGDCLGDSMPSRTEVGDDETKVISQPAIHLSDTKDAIAFASQMALVDDKPSISTNSDHLDVLGVLSHIDKLKDNI